MTLRRQLRRLIDRLTAGEGGQDVAAVCTRIYFGAAAKMLGDVAGRDRGEPLVPGWVGLTVGEFADFLTAELECRPGPDDGSMPAVGRHVVAWTRLREQTTFRADLEAARPGPVPMSWWWWVGVGYSADRQDAYRIHASALAYGITR